MNSANAGDRRGVQAISSVIACPLEPKYCGGPAPVTLVLPVMGRPQLLFNSNQRPDDLACVLGCLAHITVPPSHNKLELTRHAYTLSTLRTRAAQAEHQS